MEPFTRVTERGRQAPDQENMVSRARHLHYKARAHCETHRGMSASFAIHQQPMVNVEIKLEALLSEKPRYEALGKS